MPVLRVPSRHAPGCDMGSVRPLLALERRLYPPPPRPGTWGWSIPASFWGVGSVHPPPRPGAWALSVLPHFGVCPGTGGMASHTGGPPGFPRAAGPRVWPDAPGRAGEKAATPEDLLWPHRPAVARRLAGAGSPLALVAASPRSCPHIQKAFPFPLQLSCPRSRDACPL